MRPQTIGRTLGIGLRVAGRVASQRLAGQAQPHSAQTIAGAQVRTQTARRAGVTRKALGEGVAGLLRPFRRAGGILWLEITGAFFLLPAAVFAPTVWRTRLSWLRGPDHRTFWAAAVVVSVFLYLGLTSFWRARRRARAVGR
jgi:hypothetical protein